MTQDRADQANASGTSPFAALSETIEALEARLDELMANRNRAAPAAPEAETAPPEVEAAAPSIEEPAPVRDTTALIRERQRRLDVFRERTARARAPVAAEPTEPLPQREPEEQAPVGAHEEVATFDGSSESDLREVAGALVALRRELRDQLRQDFGQDIARQVGSLRSELVQIKALAERDTMPEALKDELAMLARHVEALNGSNGHQVDALRSDIATLSERMQQVVHDETLRGLDGRWDEIRAMLGGSEGVRDEIAALTARLDELQEALLALGGEDANVKAEMQALTSAIEQLLVQESAGTAHAEEFEGLNRRLDDLAGIVTAIGAAADPAAADTLSTQIAMLGERVEALAAQDTAAPIAARIDNLCEQIAVLGQEGSPAVIEEIADYLRDISARIDTLAEASAAASPDTAILDRFEALVTRAENQTGSSDHQASLEELHRQLDGITGRLDRSLAATPASDDAVRGLEAQIATLSRLMNERGEAADGDAIAVIAPRLEAIESHITRSQDDIIEAASKAAERAVASFLESGVDDFDGSADEMKAVAGLAEDLRSLSDMTRMSDERQARAFDAVHDTLLKIAERLEHLDRSRPLDVQPAEEAVAAGTLTALGTPIEDTPDIVPAEPRSPAAGSQSLLGRLAQRVRPRQDVETGALVVAQASAVSARERLTPTPSIDPADALDQGAANEPLEPGSGTPDINRILQKVRQQQSDEGSDAGAERSEADRADFIAAARRAAQAAAADVESASQKRSGKKSGAKASGDGTSKRRPILIAAGAVLLAVMSYPLAADFFGDAPAEQAADVAEPVKLATTNETTASIETGTANGSAEIDIATDATMADGAPTPPVTRPAETATVTAPATLASPMTDEAAAEAPGTRPTANLTPDTSAEPETNVTEPADAEAITETPETAPDTELQASLDALPAGAAPIALVEAARDGDPRALFELGARNAEGRGVAVDEEAAARWYREAAERGLAPAQYRLATATEKGIGVERDLDAARRLYEEAAEAGNIRAMHNLAVLHASGVTGEPNYKLAAEWFERAAEHGVADSQFNIAVLYARGSGVEQDLAQSYKWFAIAAEGGDTGAEAKRDEVAEAMDAAALEAARAEVEAWKPQPADEDANEVVLPEGWGIDTTESASTDPARTISSVQRILNAQGFDAGTPDGILGENTVAAIRAFQEAEGLDVTGQIDGELVQALIKSERRG